MDAALPLDFSLKASPADSHADCGQLESPGLEDWLQEVQRVLRANQALAMSRLLGVAPATPPSAWSPVPVTPVPPPQPVSQPAAELQRVNTESLASYSQFREQMLRQFAMSKVKRRRGSSSSTSSASPNVASEDDASFSRALSDASPSSPVEAAAGKKKRRHDEDIKDEAYWERRKKNNEAAKRSRDLRRAKEDEIAIRAAFLEQENIQLRLEMAKLKAESCRLKAILLSDAPDRSVMLSEDEDRTAV